MGVLPSYPLSATQYLYENATWSDILTGVKKSHFDNGVEIIEDRYSISSDTIGNITNLNGFNYTWVGRQLKSVSPVGDSSVGATYSYNSDGQRIGKNITLDGGEVYDYDYYYNGDILAGYKLVITKSDGSSTTHNIAFMYDENGEAFGFNYNGNDYYYVRNAQSDVIFISNSDNTGVVMYQYDAWGNPEFPKAQDGIEHLGDNLVMAFITMFNPFKYKGYLYDYETGLYYCQSRYYSPVWSRFLNMDDTSILNLTQGETLGANLYAYCYNNPINNIDPNGYLTISRWALALGLDVILTLVVPYFSGPLDIFGRGLKALANKKNFTLVWEKLLYGAVPKFKGLFSRGFTGIRTAIWRVTGSWISNSTTSLIGANITNFVRLFRSSGWNKAWDIASCFFSAGSMIAGLLDYLDGRFDGKCKVW